jgi:hypothetical protein
MLDSGWRPDSHTRSSLACLSPDHKCGLAFEYEVELILVGMCMRVLLLASLQAIQSKEDDGVAERAAP